MRFAAGLLLIHGIGMSPSVALEGAFSPYPKGYRDFLSGVLPSPGVQVRFDTIHYEGREKHAAVRPGRLSLNARTTNAILNVNVITNQRILDAHYAFGFRVAATDVSASRSLRTATSTISRSGEMFGMNDLAVSPIILGWHAGNFHWNFSTTVWVPVGDYDVTRAVNTGRNFWSWSPQFAMTYAPPSGWEVSGAVSYIFNIENPATRYHSGEVLHFDFALGRQITRGLKFGAVGYMMQQTTPDTGPGATLGDRKAKVLGLGPGATFTVPVGNQPVTIAVKYFREFDASNTVRGDTLVFSSRMKF